MGTFVLVQLLSARLSIPVIAAGGIADAAGVRAAAALGAQAAQLGTAFLACAQSGASDLHRQALFNPAAEQTTLTRAFSGRLARGLQNTWTRLMHGRQQALPPFPVTNWFTSQLRAAAVEAGRSDLVSPGAGRSHPSCVTAMPAR